MLFIIGIFVLIATRSFWPGIFVLIGLTNFYKQSLRGHTRQALREIVFWAGFALLIATGTFWPGIILLLIASSLINHSGWCWKP
jgi:predicted membrane protein